MNESNSGNFGKKIFRETVIYSIGSFGSKVLSFLLLPFYTFWLTKKDIGEYDILITTITLFIPLISLQISDSAYRWLIDREKDNEKLKGQIITNTFIAFGLGFLIFSFFFIVYITLESFDNKGYFFALMFLNSLLPILQSILRGEGKTTLFAFNGLLTTFLVIVFNFLFIYGLKLKVEGILLANIVAYSLACTLIIVQLKLTKYFSFQNYDKLLLVQMTKYSLPLIPNLMSWWVIGSASKFIILHYLGAESNGIYAISSRFPSIIVIVNTIFVLPIQDAFLKQDLKTQDLAKLLKQFIQLEFSIVVLLIAAAPIYTKFLVNDEFYDSWRYMGFLYLGVGFNTIAALISLVYQKNKKTIRITYSTIMGGVLSIGMCFLLIRDLGLLGVSISYFVGFLSIFTLRYYDLKDELKLGLNDYYCLFILIATIGFTFLINILNFKLQLILFVLVLAAILLLNRRIINKYIRR